MNISVAVRAKLWAFEEAQQLQRHGMLSRLYTSYWGRFLHRDNSSGYNIPRQKVATNLLSALRTYGFPGHKPLEAERYFGNWVAASLGSEDAVVTWGLQAKPIIEAAKKKQIKVILERGSSHVVYQRDILLEEHRNFGASTAGLEASFSAERVEQEIWEYQQADLIVVPSAFVKRTFLMHGIDAHKIFVNNFGVNLQQFTPGARKDDTFRIIYAGQLTFRKGIQYLLQAFYELKLPAELWLVGKLHDDVKPLLSKWGNGVTHFEPVPQSRLRDYYVQCDAFALCSVEEGLALVQPQAMACGLPLICTTNTGGEDIVTPGADGFVLPIRDVEALKEKILYLFQNRDICRNMGVNARLKVHSGLSWDDYGDRMARKYRQLCSDNG